MKKLLVLAAITVAFSFTTPAQTTGATGTKTGAETTTTTTTTTNKPTKKTTGTATTLTGCLAKNASGTGYTLANSKFKKGVEVNTSKDFSAHVGHTVKLTGTWEKPANGTTMKVFDATRLRHVSATCTVGDKGKSSTKASGTGTTTSTTTTTTGPK